MPTEEENTEQSRPNNLNANDVRTEEVSTTRIKPERDTKDVIKKINECTPKTFEAHKNTGTAVTTIDESSLIRFRNNFFEVIIQPPACSPSAYSVSFLYVFKISRSHYQECLTCLYMCHGVFIDRAILRSIFLPIEIPQE